MDGDLTAFHCPRGFGTTPYQRSLNPAFERQPENLLPPLVKERCLFDNWASPSSEKLAKSQPDVRNHHTHQDMVCRAFHGCPWSFKAQSNRAMSTQVLYVASSFKGTIDHAPETESWRVTLLASGIGIQGPSIQWWTPTSIHFWEAQWYGR